VTRTSHYAWMALGGVLCLLGAFVFIRTRDGNKAMAQSEPPTVVSEKPAAPPPAPLVPQPLPPISPATPVSTDPIPAPPSPAVEAVPAAAVVPAPVETALPPPPPAVSLNASEPPPPVTPPPTPPAAGSDSRPIVIPASATVPAPPAPVAAPPTPSEKPLPPIAEKTDALPPSPTVAPPSPTVNVSPPPMPPAIEPVSRPDTAAKDYAPEPPLAPNPGPVVQHKILAGGETLKSLARKMLGTAERWTDIHKLNPNLRPDANISVGTTVRLPGDACVGDDHESVRPLPSLRPRSAPKAKAALPLTGTFPIAVDDHKVMSLPSKILEQLGHCDTVLLSPGSDRCLWLTNQAHLDRLQAKLDKSPARESDVRGFKRLYYAQTMKVPVKDGKLAISDKLAAFAGLGAEVVLVGIDDHFEVWDAARWRRYMQTKKANSED
jgi:division/cell wall cluster transcriptional repressor MraZ